MQVKNRKWKNESEKWKVMKCGLNKHVHKFLVLKAPGIFSIYKFSLATKDKKNRVNTFIFPIV
jgi:hypothetical protein